jgi:hypothetical protein
MNLFGQSETNKSGFDKIQERTYTNRWGYAQTMVGALREFLKFPLPRNVTFFNATKARTQQFLAELDRQGGDDWLEFVASKGVALGYQLEQVFQATNRRINRQYNATQLKQMSDASAARMRLNEEEFKFIGTWELGNSLEDDRVITELQNVSVVNVYFAGITQIRDRRGGYGGQNVSYQNLAIFLFWAMFQETERRYNVAKQAELAAQRAAELAEQQAQMVTTQPINRQELLINHKKLSGLGYFGFGLGNIFDASKDDYGNAADIDIAALTDESKDDEPLFTNELVKKGGGYTDPRVRPNPYESDVIRYKDDEMKETFVLQDYAPKGGGDAVIPKEVIDSVVVKPTEVIRKDDGAVIKTKEVLVQDGLTLPNGGAVTPDVKLTTTHVVTEKGETIKVVATSEGELPTKTVITEEGEKKYLVDSAGVPKAEVRTSATTGSPIVATNPATGEKTVVVSTEVPKEVKTAATQQIVDAPKSAATSAATSTSIATINTKKAADTTSNKGLMAMLLAAGLALGISYVGNK